MKDLKSINIKGKEYVEVNERLRYFRQNYKNYSLESEVIEKTDTSIMIRAIIKDANDRIIATGLAEEVKGSTFINKTSYVENCETSAWGRALGNLGIGIETSVASYEEVANAIKQQESKPKRKLSKDEFKQALTAVDEGRYTKNKLKSEFNLSTNQLKTLELC
jgi:hypothetical protein